MPQTPGTFKELVGLFLGIIDQLVVLIFGLVFVFVAYKLVVAWILNADSDTSREEGKSVAITAVIVLMIMVSIWGILRLLQESFF